MFGRGDDARRKRMHSLTASDEGDPIHTLGTKHKRPTQVADIS